MRLPILMFVAVASAAIPAHAAPATASDAAAIRAVMDDSAKAWSAGDLDRFMQSYERGPDTTFVTSHGLVRGYDAIAAHYRTAYAKPGADLGKLSFDVGAIEGLGPGYAVLYGRFHLTTRDRPTEQTGVFDLILHKGPSGWRILSDHTS